MYTETKTSKIALKELPELVDAYLQFKMFGNDMTGLMNLIQDQTSYMQKRFWALVDAEVAA